ncbi:MAG TPA: hypothetical protein PKD11_09590 [Pyrinomonadaceae bacterium]|nr:hypothetical protein [Pyrinomonadaceae bacterium]
MAEEKTKAPKHRSPNYPFISLEDAVMRLRQLNETGRGHYVQIGTARDIWDYKRNAGDRTAAALKAYGLIEVQGEGEKRELRPTEDGIKILEGHSQSADLLKKAALCPDIHKDVWDKYNGNFPADAVMREYLRWEKKFNPDNVDKFIEQFRTTIAFANLTESDKSDSKGDSDQGVSPSSGGRNMHEQQVEQSPPPPGISSPRVNMAGFEPVNFATSDVLTFNLSRTGKAQVSFNGQVTQEAIKKLIALLDLSVDTYPTEDELKQPRRAMWHNKDHDQPVTVTGEISEKDGERLYSIAESGTGIPEDELEFEEGN